MVGALGVVFGDIGTSPLYAMKECFDVGHNVHAVSVSANHVLGVLSLIFWSLVLVVAVKYIVFVLRADRNGEGGVLALLSLALGKARPAVVPGLVLAGMFGAALLYGDGMITPAISVLSAVEGLKTATGLDQKAVILITVVILTALFSFQRLGTDKVGRVFGPVMVLWFSTIAVLGLSQIVRQPQVLLALSPTSAFNFFLDAGWHGYFVLGSVVLVVTGAESVYADLGHFGARPIRLAWFWMVMPALLLNYFGQAAWLLSHPEAPSDPEFSPFFMMAPGWARLPLVALATVSTVIASQALISGVYSLTLQANQLGCLPRVSIRHTSAHTRGQIYVPVVNWALMLACIGLVLGFKDSKALAAAYGIAVTMTMIVTTVLLYFAARGHWGWGMARALPLAAVALAVELAFFGANISKIPAGGWFPLVMGSLIFTVMTTWREGRRLILQEQETSALSQEDFLASLSYGKGPVRVPGTAVFMSGSRGRTPVALLHNLKHNKVMHQRVIFLTLVTDNVPYVAREDQVELETLGDDVFRITGHYGFMQEPDVPQLLRRARSLHQFCCDASEATFFLGRETIVPSKQRGMAPWREHLFAFLAKIAQPPSGYFKLPENRVVELGMRVRI
ncbi:MAG: potassium transporter Kup [Verrucomicrobiales bacterium]